MIRRPWPLLCLALLILTLLPLTRNRAVAQSTGILSLHHAWTLQSSAKVHETGDLISTGRFKPAGWYPTTVPTTVVAALVQAKVYPDPTFGMNLRHFPGMDYPVGANFSLSPRGSASPFAVSWWYRNAFVLPARVRNQTVWLNFDGINYRANVWINGHQVADTSSTAGAWRHFEFDITAFAHPGGRNVVAVQVFPPTEKDLAITFVDWNPMPPDKDMGLFREVYVAFSGPVALRHPAVLSQVNSPANDQAQLTVTSQVVNATDRSIQGRLRGRIGTIAFARNVTLSPHETQAVTFSPSEFPQLTIQHPQLWWPKQMGSPHLYRLHLSFEIAGAISDQSDSRFGIRQITSEVTSPTRRLFRINGKPLLIRGGGWATDFMLRENSQRLQSELDYVQDMRLNTIRLEGRPETQEFYNQADRRGILVMAGWSCCDFWEQWPHWTDEDHAIAADSLRSQMFRLRGHPSLLMWLNGSDNAPPLDQQQTYLDIEKELLWPNPILPSATSKLEPGNGNSGVRMTGPYEYVAPSYWLEDSQADQPGHACTIGGCGGAHGFNTETSPGPAVPPIESLRKMLGPDHLWPIDDTWNFHAGGGVFGNLAVYTNALNRRYGTARDADDYAKKSQLMAYEGIRAMYEAYSRNKYESTGVIQWMLNNAWPSMIWHLYDYYLRPGGGYFGAKIAMEPLHPIYGYDDRSIWVVNSEYRDSRNLRLSAAIYNLDMSQKFSREVDVDMPADSSTRVFALPDVQGLSPTYFLKLVLRDRQRRIVGSNFYWMSTTPETIDWAKSSWYDTPIGSFADYSALSQLPPVKLVTSSTTRRQGDQATTSITLRNPSKNLAFCIRLKLDRSAGGEEILPILWQDNYFSLLPGEAREITAKYSLPRGSANPVLEVKGWNAD